MHPIQIPGSKLEPGIRVDYQATFQNPAFMARWVSGDLTKAETTQFERWLEENPDEKGYYCHLRSICEDMGTVRLPKGHAAEQRWVRIRKAIDLLEAS